MEKKIAADPASYEGGAAFVEGRFVPVGEGTPGPTTLRLREAYWEAHRDPRFATPVEYS